MRIFREIFSRCNFWQAFNLVCVYVYQVPSFMTSLQNDQEGLSLNITASNPLQVTKMVCVILASTVVKHLVMGVAH